jgi:hypothetical protein
MKILQNIAGMAGSQAAVWLAIGAIAFLLTGEGSALDAGYTTGNF